MIYDDVEILDKSPEVAALATCPHCGSSTFTGACLTAVIDQHFTPPLESGESAEYESHDAEIGEYQYVICTNCDGLVWFDAAFFLTHAQVEAVTNLCRAAGIGEQGVNRVRGALVDRSRAILDYPLERAKAQLAKLKVTP